MSCEGSLSNYERKKLALINVNKWKSNFVSLWRKYGKFKTVDGVECFDYYDIDGNGEGQIRMSKLLKQPTLHKDVQDDDLDWVHLVFDLSKLIEIDDEGIALWLADYKTQLESYSFDRLVYVIEDGTVTSHAFYLSGEIIDDPFLNHLSLLIAERNKIDHFVGIYTYDELVTVDDVKVLMDDLASYSFSDGDMIFDVPLIEKDIAAFMMIQGIGTNILDELVSDGLLIGLGNISTGNMTYAFPVEVAKKMNGYSFVKIIENALEFKYKVDSHWYDFFLKIIKLVLAVVAAYFGFYYVALSLVLSFAADVTGSQILKILSTVVSLLSGGVDGLLDMGVSEAVSLLMNVYALYVELSYKPEKTTEEEVVDSDQEMFYKAPYSAYSDLYCYKNLISVSLYAKY